MLTRFRGSRTALAALVVAVLLVLTPALASAHEHRDIDNGRYTMIVGFSSEPSYTGFLNGLDLRVSDNSAPASPVAATSGDDDDATAGAPVEGLEDTLQAEIIYNDQKMPLTLEPRWQTPGAYDAWVVPTAAGDYTFHIFGTINGTAVDESFTSSPDTFSSVTDQTTIQFPKASASTTGSAPIIGSVSAGGGIDGGAIGGALAGLAAGAAGLYLIQRRRRAAGPRLAAQGVGAGD